MFNNTKNNSQSARGRNSSVSPFEKTQHQNTIIKRNARLIKRSIVDEFGYIIAKESISFIKDIMMAKFISTYKTCSDDMTYQNIIDWMKDNATNNIKRQIIKGHVENCNLLSYGIYAMRYKQCILLIKSSRSASLGTNYQIELYIFSLSDRSARLIEEIKMYSNNNSSNSVPVHIMTCENTNVRNNFYSISCKLLDNVFIDNLSVIKDHINRYINNKEYYNNLNLIYKYNLLLYGEPGTGKTTLIKAIAHKLGYSILYLSLDVLSNPSVIKNISSYSKIVIVIEDIDRFIDDNGKIPYIDKLMNITDGIISPSEVFIIVTTNHLDKIKRSDDAFLRKGRFDDIIEIGPIKSEELARKMCIEYKADPDVILKDMTYPINQSELQSKILLSRKNN